MVAYVLYHFLHRTIYTYEVDSIMETKSLAYELVNPIIETVQYDTITTVLLFNTKYGMKLTEVPCLVRRLNVNSPHCIHMGNTYLRFVYGRQIER